MTMKGVDPRLSKNINWDLSARYYDAFIRADFDLPFFLEQARSTGGPALELMCGTGRISIPLAETGVPVTALDSSAGMLALFRSKLAGRGLSVRLVEADARSFDLGERFPLVFIGFHAFAEVLGQEDRLDVLRSVRAHLAEGGRFLLTLHNPPIRAAAAHPEWRVAGSVLLESGLTLEVSSHWDVDRIGGRVSGIQRYRELDIRGRCIEETPLPIMFDLVTPAEVHALAARAGLAITGVCGDYDGSAFDESRSPYMIFTMVPSTHSCERK
jgi:SAM-dependent methyltransferase